MKSKHYFDESANLLKQLRFFRFIIFVLAIAVVINGFFTYSAKMRNKTILIPPHLEEEAYVSYYDASENYLASMARYVLSLRLNYTPANISQQFNAYLKMISSELYPEEMKALYKIRDEVINNHVSSVFYPEKFEVNREKKRIYVVGRLNQWTHDKKFLVDEKRAYVIEYDFNVGRFGVTNLISCGQNENLCPK